LRRRPRPKLGCGAKERRRRYGELLRLDYTVSIPTQAVLQGTLRCMLYGVAMKFPELLFFFPAT
jgi:hypothetical protein